MVKPNKEWQKASLINYRRNWKNNQHGLSWHRIVQPTFLGLKHTNPHKIRSGSFLTSCKWLRNLWLFGGRLATPPYYIGKGSYSRIGSWDNPRQYCSHQGPIFVHWQPVQFNHHSILKNLHRTFKSKKKMQISNLALINFPITWKLKLQHLLQQQLQNSSAQLTAQQ